MYGLYSVEQHNFLWSQPLDNVSGGPPTFPFIMGQNLPGFEKAFQCRKFTKKWPKHTQKSRILIPEKLLEIEEFSMKFATVECLWKTVKITRILTCFLTIESSSKTEKIISFFVYFSKNYRLVVIIMSE